MSQGDTVIDESPAECTSDEVIASLTDLVEAVHTHTHLRHKCRQIRAKS